MRKTLELKQIISEEVRTETKRCLAILEKVYYSDKILDQVKDDLLDRLFIRASNEMIKGCPYSKFYPELEKDHD